MLFKQSFFFISIFLVLTTASLAQDLANQSLETETPTILSDTTVLIPSENIFVLKDSLTTVLDTISPVQTKTPLVYPPTHRDWKRLGYASGMYIGTTVIVFGALWIMPESITNWDKEDIKEKGFLWHWNRNVKRGPVKDKDNFVLNWLTHPYSGGIYYMTARSSGFTVIESFGYSAIMSTFFWEYGIEAFAEIPSIQDLIITPVVGAAVGEGFFYAKKSILRNDRKVLKSKFLGYTTLFLMDPFNTLLDSFGYKEKVKTQMNVAPVGVNQFTGSAIWGVHFTVGF